ncbi:MAG: outer membrane lipoprotein-sorting protein [Nitrospirae bacterium]|nr:outer membrane lipoprotein-sorting protein [Nitrospirota bacterium]
MNRIAARRKFLQQRTMFLLMAMVLAVGLPRAWGGQGEVAEVLRQVGVQDDAVNTETAQMVIRSIDARGTEKTSRHHLYWKNVRGEKGVFGKTLLVTLAPLNQKGEAFLLWQSKRATDSQAWLYLPELRQVRRVPIAGHEAHHHEHESDVNLGFEQMGTRLTESDELTLVGREILDGRGYLVLESRSTSEGTPPLRRVWVSPETWTIHQIEYRDAQGMLEKTQRVEWEQIRDAWVWKRTEIQKAHSLEKTIVELNDVAVNPELDDRLFTMQTLQSGHIP